MYHFMTFKKNKSQKSQKPLLYGFHAVREAWLNPDRNIGNLYLTDHALKGFEQTLHEAKGKGLRRPPHTLVDKKKIEKRLPQGAVHQGLMLECSELDEMDVQDLIIRTQDQDNVLLLMLDQVTDPHNVGAIIRSASAFGAAGMVMQSKHSPNFDGVLAKTACGGLEHMPIALETNLSRAIETLKENGFFIYGLSEHAKDNISEIVANGDKSVSNEKKAQKSVLILGAEGSGIRRLIRENCDELLKLPTQKPIESLNVSNAAAVALYAFKN